MLTCLWADETLGQPKVYERDLILLLTVANEDVLWLDVSMEEVLAVYPLEPTYGLGH